jgi:hypothetical protein
MTQTKPDPEKAQQARSRAQTQKHLGARLRRHLEDDQPGEIPDEFMALLKKADQTSRENNSS